jgi:hypothetical protein
MRPTRYFYFLAAIVTLAVLGKLNGCVAVNLGGGSPAARFEETRALTAPAASAVVVRTQNGFIALRRGTSPDTAVTATLRAQTKERLAAARVVADRQPDGALLLAVEWPGGRPLGSEACSFDVTLAAVTDAVTADTTNGAITLASLSGPARLHTTNGRVAVDDHRGDVTAVTTNGAVVLTRVTGDADAHTTNGAVELRDVGGRATAHTTNGRVTVALAGGAGPVDVCTTNGSADVTLPKSFAGRLSLATSNGAIRYPAAAPTLHDLSRSRTSASFSLGDNAASSTVQTTNGSIDVRLAD